MKKIFSLGRRYQLLILCSIFIFPVFFLVNTAYRNEKYYNRDFSVLINTQPLTNSIQSRSANESQTSNESQNSNEGQSIINSNPAEENQKPLSTTYSIEIPKINIKAPIILFVDGNNKERYMKALESGVAHLDGSAVPGDSGNAVIFGHSSYFSYKSGGYKEIFAKLNELETGDQINVKTNNGKLNFKVTEKKVVEPENVEVAYQNFQKKNLTLITCWPVGTIDKRLVIVGALEI